MGSIRSVNLRKIQYPSYAVSHFDFGEIQLVRNIRVAQALACQTINGAQNSSSFPKDTYEFNL
jgi:hypothetical protein